MEIISIIVLAIILIVWFIVISNIKNISKRNNEQTDILKAIGRQLEMQNDTLLAMAKRLKSIDENNIQ
jgi:uncharacterized membrane protein